MLTNRGQLGAGLSAIDDGNLKVFHRQLRFIERLDARLVDQPPGHCAINIGQIEANDDRINARNDFDPGTGSSQLSRDRLRFTRPLNRDADEIVTGRLHEAPLHCSAALLVPHLPPRLHLVCRHECTGYRQYRPDSVPAEQFVRRCHVPHPARIAVSTGHPARRHDRRTLQQRSSDRAALPPSRVGCWANPPALHRVMPAALL